MDDPLLIEVPERIAHRAPGAARAAARRRRRWSTTPIRVSHAALLPWMPWARPDADRRRVGSALPPAAGALHPARRPGDVHVRARLATGGEGEFVGGTRPAPDRLGAAPLRDRLLAQERLRRPRLRHRGGARARAHGLRFARRPPRRDPHGRQQRQRSWQVAERAGFTLEAILRFDAATPQGEPRSTRVYARVHRRRRADGRSGRVRRARSVRHVGARREAIDRVGDDAVDADASSRRASAGSLTV